MTGSQVVGHELGEIIRQAVPPWLVPLFIVITRLGNPAFFLALFVLDYWFGDHKRGAHALGLAIAGMALVTGLKTFFDAPRPPEAVNLIPIGGYSFPSGHATGSTIGYGILAHDLEVSSARVRYAVAALLIVLIALSRVVLGVHFVRDVVAGVVIGVIFLAVVFFLTEHSPRPGFALAIVFGAAAFVISGASQDGAAVFGGGLGAAVAWERLDAIPRLESLQSQFVLLGGFLPVIAGLGYVAIETEISILLVFVLNAILMAGVLASPLVAKRFD